ncbi:MAG: cupredoxin domain-containing protein [Proteobacteria bacterium]|nr:cupredoxin domain-containing protein [Pseudomonadota bacterium]
MLSHALRHALPVAAVLLLAGSQIATASDPNTIVIKNFDFSPMQTTVSVGATVTWQNQDEEPHTVTSDSGAFRSGAIDGGASFTFKFDKPGTYKYVCSIHPKMVGTVVVK